MGRDGNRLVASATGPHGAAPALLLHGGGQTRHSWRTTAESLAQSGWRTYALDLRGHGESDWANDGDYTLEAFAGDVRAVCEQLEAPPVLVGASLGGISSLAAVGESGRQLARALVLVDIAPRIEPAGRARIGAFMREHVETGFASLEEVADAIQRYNPHRPRPKDLSRLKKNLRRADDGRWYWHWDPAFLIGRFGDIDETRSFDVDRLQRAAAAITLPTLLVRGQVSDLLSEDGARDLLLLMPHAELVDVAGAGHMVAGDRNDLFNDSIVRFLGPPSKLGPSSTSVTADPP